VIIAVTVGGSMFGFIGMLIGVPTLALILYIVDRLTQGRVKKKNLPSSAEEYINVDHIDSESGGIVYLEEKGQEEKEKTAGQEKTKEKE